MNVKKIPIKKNTKWAEKENKENNKNKVHWYKINVIIKLTNKILGINVMSFLLSAVLMKYVQSRVNVMRQTQTAFTCGLSRSDVMKSWLSVSKWACDWCRWARASSKVIAASSRSLVASPLAVARPPRFLLFPASSRSVLVARRSTSERAWMLSWKPNRREWHQWIWDHAH